MRNKINVVILSLLAVIPNLFRDLLDRCLPLRSTAARRLAKNAPLEHFYGLQPSLPKFGVTLVDKYLEKTKSYDTMYIIHNVS